MKTNLLKPLLASLLMIGCASAQAAHLEVTSYAAPTIAYQGLVGTTPFSANGAVISNELDALAFSGIYDDVSGASSYGYSADAYLIGGSNLTMSSMQYFESSAQTVYFGSTIDSVMDVNLKVMAADTESTVNVTFNGSASSFLTSTSGTSVIALTVRNGNTVLASYYSTSATLDNAPISFSFQAQKNDTLTLSASVSNNLVAFAPTVGEVGAGGLLAGGFNVVAVPEPEQYAMLLAGLGLIAGIARRRR